MKRKLAALVGAGVITLALTGCSAGESAQTTNPQPDTVVFEKTLPDNTTITCIALLEYQEGGLTCDWYGYYQQHNQSEEE